MNPFRRKVLAVSVFIPQQLCVEEQGLGLTDVPRLQPYKKLIESPRTLASTKDVGVTKPTLGIKASSNIISSTTSANSVQQITVTEISKNDSKNQNFIPQSVIGEDASYANGDNTGSYKIERPYFYNDQSNKESLNLVSSPVANLGALPQTLTQDNFVVSDLSKYVQTRNAQDIENLTPNIYNQVLAAEESQQTCGLPIANSADNLQNFAGNASPKEVDNSARLVHEQTNSFSAPLLQENSQMAFLSTMQPASSRTTILSAPEPKLLASLVNSKQTGLDQLQTVEPTTNNNINIVNKPLDAGSVVPVVNQAQLPNVPGNQNGLINDQLYNNSNAAYQKLDIARSPSSKEGPYKALQDEIRAKMKMKNMEKTKTDKSSSQIPNLDDEEVKRPLNYRTHDRQSAYAEYPQSKTQLEERTDQRRSVYNQQPEQQMKGKNSANENSIAQKPKSRSPNDDLESNLIGQDIRLKSVLPFSTVGIDTRALHKSNLIGSDSVPYQQPLQIEEELLHDSLDSPFRPVNRVQPAPRNIVDLAIQRAVEQMPSSEPQMQPQQQNPAQPQPPGTVVVTDISCTDPVNYPATNGMNVNPGFANANARKQPEPAAGAAAGAGAAAAMGGGGNGKNFELSPVREGSVSPKQSQLHKLVQQLYQAEAQVQLEAQQIQQAQAVAAAAQQTLEEAANNVKVISAALQSAQESVASAAIRAHIAQLQLAAHDQMLFTARQNVDSLSAQMVGLQAEVGISYDVHHLNVPELLGRLQQPLNNEQTPTPIPTLIPLLMNPSGPSLVDRNYLKFNEEFSNIDQRLNDDLSRPIRSNSDGNFRDLTSDQFALDPNLVFNSLRSKYRRRRDILMLLDELQKPIVDNYERRDE